LPGSSRIPWQRADPANLTGIEYREGLLVTETLRRNVHLQYMDSAMTINGAAGVLGSVK
jgi:hypothetical protein